MASYCCKEILLSNIEINGYFSMLDDVTANDVLKQNYALQRKKS